MNTPSDSSVPASFVRRVLPKASGPGRLLAAMDRLERSPSMDPLVKQLRQAVHGLPLGRGRDVLHGRWLGHPLHPLLVQLPVGAWLSAAVLDMLPGRRRGADVLVAVGLAGALPAALAGWVDWADLRTSQLRVGVVHAAANVSAVALYSGSLAARLRGRGALGRALALAGLTSVSVGGALGGHMAYRQASGANHAEEVPDIVAPGWHPVGDVADFPVGEPVRGFVDGVQVLVVREAGGQVHILADRCSHMGGPLSQGKVADGCVECPWHGSVFRLVDGWNVRGPATAPQPAFTTRVVEGRVEARITPLSAPPED